jgi:hypothetical protein
MNRYLPFALVALVGCAESALAQAPAVAPTAERDIPSVQTMTRMLRSATKHCGFDQTEEAEAAVVALGDRAFPAYEAILADPKSDDRLIRSTFRFIARVDADRRRFVPLVVRRLAPNTVVNPQIVQSVIVNQIVYRSAVPEPATFLQIASACGERIADENYVTRYHAARLLGEIGDEREAATLRPLLTDYNGSVRYGAADALAKVGGKRDLDAMNAWLNAADPRKDASEQQYITKRRDELKARLKANPFGKATSN